MAYRMIDIYAHQTSLKSISTAIEGSGALNAWQNALADNAIHFTVLISSEKAQALLDKLQSVLGHNPGARLIVKSVDAILPKPDEPEKPKNKPGNKTKKDPKASISREELYQDVARGARLDRNYLLLVVFSTIVAAIGMIENNVAVVIGAMVIAPFLGPNLALALSTTLGDTGLMIKALRTNLIGIALTLSLTVLLGRFWPGTLNSVELLSRTTVGYDGIVLALSSGAAAVLSLTTGLSSVLVGVMVAVALLPPAATMGIMLGAGQVDLALGALLLLTVNIVCVNLSAKFVFLYQGIQPRKWFEKEKAKRATVISAIAWLLALTILVFAIYIRGGVTT